LVSIAVGAVLYSIFYLSIGGIVFVGTGFYFFINALLLPLVFFYFPLSPRVPKDKVPWYDWILATLSLGTAFYFFMNSFNILNEGWEVAPPKIAWIFALVLFFLSLEACRRAGDWGLFIIVVFFAFLPMFTTYMPGILRGIDYSFYRMISFHVMGPEGLVGLPIRVLGELLIGFIIFGVVMGGTGGGKFFLDLSSSLFGQFRGGAAKVSIFSSGLFGALSGSAISNTITTGTLTIPAMKKSGFPPHVAGAVEATASCGGVLMPPVMGAVAFIMAMWLEIPYGTVIISAALPSALYFFSLFVQVDSLAAIYGLRGLPKEELPSVRQTLKEGWYYIIAFALLIFTLVVLRQEGRAPFYASAVLLIITMLKKSTRLNWSSFFQLIENIGKTLSEILGLLLGVSLIISALFYTGIASSFAKEITLLAGGNVYLLVLLAAVISFILGLGMPVLACYVFLALTLAPALTALGLNPLAVHLFMVYAGVLGLITPPLCVPAFIAAGIAGAPPMKTGWMATRIGIVLFLLPFFFILNPALIAQGPIQEILYRFFLAAFGLTLIASGVEGYLLLIGRVGIIARVFLFSSGLFLAFPHLVADFTGVALALITIAAAFLVKRFGAPRQNTST
jgi:TRAP transporter 4TM/12TM fusion protein